MIRTFEGAKCGVRIIRASYPQARGCNKGSGGVIDPEGTRAPGTGASRGTGWHRHAPVSSKLLRTSSAGWEHGMMYLDP
jgi:hypothetical protein